MEPDRALLSACQQYMSFVDYEKGGGEQQPMFMLNCISLPHTQRTEGREEGREGRREEERERGREGGREGGRTHFQHQE